MKRSNRMSTGWAGKAALLLSGALVLPGYAQTVLKGKDLTEQNLIEALKPGAAPPAAADGEEIKLRSIRVTRDQPSAKVVEQAARAQQPAAPSASVLITFVTNSAELTSRARSSLDVVAHALQSDQLASFRFVIEGHADPRGNAQDNLRLSQARAESVVDYLVTRHGVSRSRLNAVGKGDTELLNTQQIDAPENRRVTIVTLRE